MIAKNLWLLVFAGLFCLFSWFLYQEVSPVRSHCDIDSSAYLEKGLLFFHTNSFASPGQTQPYYTMGYPFVIGLLYKTFGPLCHPELVSGSTPINIIILFQLLLALLSCFLIARVAQRFFGKQAGIIAAGLFSINLGYLVFTQFILTEILLSFLLLLFFERITTNKILQAGLALGLSIIVKPAAIFFVLPVCLLLLFFKTGFLKTALFALCFYLPVLGYMTYNKIVFNQFCISTLDKVNLYYWFFPNVLAQKNKTTSDIERTKLLKLSGGRHDFAVAGPLFLQAFLKSPMLFLRVWLKNVFKTWAGLYTTNLKVLVEPNVRGGDISYFKMSGTIFDKACAYITAGATKQWVKVVGYLEVFFNIMRYFLCLLGLFILLKTKKIDFFILSLLFLGYFSLITGHDGCARFRMMFEFLLIVLAAGGSIPLIKSIKRALFFGKSCGS